MDKQHKSLYSLKRTIYLWVVPCVLVSLFLNNYLQNNANAEYQLSSIINTVLIGWFSISWLLLYRNRAIRFVELSNLFLVTMYHIITFYDALYNVLLKPRYDSLGDFIIWMPIYMMYIFLTLKNKQGLIFSLIVMGITVVPGAMNAGRFNAEEIDSLLQFYLANSVYIVVLYFAHHLVGVYSELAAAKREAYTDSLTGIANRYQLDEWLDGHIKESGDTEQAFSIIFFDIDDFKTINDRFGHHVGDAVLKEFVFLIKDSLSPNELFGRWGGEEFIIVLKEKESSAANLAESLRERIEQHDFSIAGRVTSSFGIAGYLKGDTIVSLLERADKAQYTSKKEGKNRVTLS
ncbi:GGDEF domain-containing protein [Neobacillus sp. YIM B06451]|uniref:GGDEF domain-containing protein n=1 Tax=Neobacillus sp. YIM B06451 TaxID=3070994 RepID=UPI00292E4C90|nr:GGDEF domain-containing protein [Neobacillus sp. YIM B06451]